MGSLSQDAERAPNGIDIILQIMSAALHSSAAKCRMSAALYGNAIVEDLI